MTIVPDTNVIVSAQLNPAGNEARILAYWYASQLEFALSEPILKEYQRVLEYEHIRVRLVRAGIKIDRLVNALREGSDIVSGTTPVEPITADPSDEMFLACAVETEADAIVTGDKEHLLPLGAYQNIPIVSPRQFLSFLTPTKRAA